MVKKTDRRKPGKLKARQRKPNAAALMRQLAQAISDKRIGHVRQLIAQGAPVNRPAPDKDPPLHLAALTGNKTLVDLLLATGAKPNVINTFEQNALSFAHSREVAASLVAAGTDVNQRSDCGDTPLHQHAIHGRTSVMQVLIDAGADLNALDNQGQTPLQTAIFHDRTEAVQLLVQSGVDVNRYRSEKTPPLMLALLEKKKAASLNVQTLIKAGADVNIRGGRFRATPLMYAAQNDDAEIVAELLQAGAEVNAITSTNETALTWAAVEGATECAKLLLKAGADPTVRISEKHPDRSLRAGRTAREIAVAEGHKEIVRLIDAALRKRNRK